MNGDSRNSGKFLLASVLALTLVLLQACASTVGEPIGTVESSTASSVPTQSLADEYVLQAGDEIYIQVFNDDDLTMNAKVSQAGTINYSYVGTVQVAGLTADELTESLTQQLDGAYLKNPSVNVTVQQYRSFFIDGEVRSPGSYPYEPGLTLAKAVSLAGGMTDRGSRRKINLLREINGEKRNYQVDLSQSILPGDVVTIGEGLF